MYMLNNYLCKIMRNMKIFSSSFIYLYINDHNRLIKHFSFIVSAVNSKRINSHVFNMDWSELQMSSAGRAEVSGVKSWGGGSLWASGKRPEETGSSEWRTRLSWELLRFHSAESDYRRRNNISQVCDSSRVKQKKKADVGFFSPSGAATHLRNI